MSVCFVPSNSFNNFSKSVVKGLPDLVITERIPFTMMMSSSIGVPILLVSIGVSIRISVCMTIFFCSKVLIVVWGIQFNIMISTFKTNL